jgi:HEAT repeat protein
MSRPKVMRGPLICGALLLSFASGPAGAIQESEATLLSRGWALIAKGDHAGAAGIAARALADDPNSSSALRLALEADVATGGATKALGTYERWLGKRALEDGYALRRISRAVLGEAVKGPDPAARHEALVALMADGDREAAALLQQGAKSGQFRDVSAMAAAGDERALAVLLSQLHSTPGSKTAVIAAIAATRNRAAIPQLIPILKDPRDVNRAAAADALGQLGATEAIPQLKALLQDQFFAVKLKAAGALYRLNDPAGLPVLTEVASSEHASIRVAGAREMAANPDLSWQAMVRALTDDPDPVVRLEAARLIAPFDQPLAKRVLDGLLADANLGIREAAADVVVDRVAADITTLRKLLRSGDSRIRVGAAGRILELTR